MNLPPDVQSYQHYITEAGRNELIKGIAAFKAHYGENWKKEFQTANPLLSEIIDLAANYTGEDTFLKVKEILKGKVENYVENPIARVGVLAMANHWLDGKKPDVLKLHAELKTEIDRPRF